MPPLPDEAIEAARRVNETHTWARELIVRLDRAFMGRDERNEEALHPLVTKALQLYMHGRIEGMSSADARGFAEYCMTEGMRLGQKVAPNG